MAGESIDRVVLELEARDGQFRTHIEGAATVTDKALVRIENSATRMERQVGRSFGQAAQHSRNLGYQISDIGVQLSAGTSPFIVLAQQGPQVANALEGARGAVGRFATFLSGPYGAAVLAATTMLGVWLSKTKEAAGSVDELVEKLQAQQRQAELTEQANAIFARTIEGVTKAADAAEKAVEALRLAKKGEAAQTVENIQKNLDEAESLRNATFARLADARALYEIQKQRASGPGEANERAALGLSSRLDAIRAIEAELTKAAIGAERLRTSLAKAISARTVEEENASAEEKINRKYDTQIDRAANAANASKAAQAELRKEIQVINAAREAELKRLRDAQRESRKSTSSLPSVTGQDVARALGTTINPGGGTRSVEKNKSVGGAQNSYHLSGQAIDIPLTVNGKPLTKAGIRAALEPLGIEIKELLGPGDKGHSDHFHIAFSKKRRGGDEVAKSAQQTADTEERRRQSFENELAQLLGDEIAAKRALVESAEEIAKLRLAEIETDRKAYNDNLASLVAQRKLTEEEAEQLRGINDERAKLRAELVARNEQVRAFRMEEAQRERDARVDSTRRSDEAEVLRGQSDLARTVDERNQIERRLVDLQYQEEKAQNDRVIATYESLKAKKGILESELAEAKAAADSARIRNASIGERKGNDLEGIDRNNPFDRYLDDTADFKTRAQEATVRQMLDVRDGISEGLAEELGIKSDYVKSLFSIFLDEVVFRPLAEAMRKKQSGGGGGFFDSLLSIGASLLGSGSGGGLSTGNSSGGLKFLAKTPGRVAGGHMNAGQLYRVNEAAGMGQAEFFRPDVSGTAIPLGQVNARAAQAPSQGGGVTTVRLELSGDIDARIQQQSAGVAIEVYKAGAPGIIDAAANETMRRAGRAKI